MEPRKGSMKPNFTEIARSIGVSRMTLYRVVNQSGNVSKATSQQVTEALNLHGYFTHRQHEKTAMVFDFCEQSYLQAMGEKLIGRLPQSRYAIIRCSHRDNMRRFLNACATADMVVFCSVPTEGIIRQVRGINPHAFTITITTASNADVTITPNNWMGGQLVAQHLFRLGHRHIAVFLSETHPTRMERYESFLGKMTLLDKTCRIDEINHRRGEEIKTAMLRYLEHVDILPTVIFFPAGGFAQVFWEEFASRGGEFADMGIMSYDRPQDVFANLDGIRFFDRIEFDPGQILDWAEYFITNRPMLRKTAPLHVCVEAILVETGSVKDLNKKSRLG